MYSASTIDRHHRPAVAGRSLRVAESAQNRARQCRSETLREIARALRPSLAAASLVPGARDSGSQRLPAA